MAGLMPWGLSHYGLDGCFLEASQAARKFYAGKIVNGNLLSSVVFPTATDHKILMVLG
jgi:hypothetical protein